MEKIMWDASRWGIHRVVVVKETPKTLTVKYSSAIGVRNVKRESENHKYFDTYGEAKDFRIKKIEEEISDTRLLLERLKGELGQVKGVVEPNGNS